MNSPLYRPDQASSQSDTVAGSLKDIIKLRQLLLGKEYSELLNLNYRLNHPQQRTEAVAEIISEALAKRSAEDDSLADALSSTIEQALQVSVKKDPQPIAAAIFPVIGPAIRKAIQEALNTTLEKISALLNQGLSPEVLRWRFQAWRSGVPYSEFVLAKTLVYRVEQAFLIHRESGLLIAHAISEHIESKDPDIISGMLTAITDFIVDAFGENVAQSTSVDSFQLGDLTVNVQAGPVATLALVVRGVAASTLKEIQYENLEQIHRLYGKELRVFDEDVHINSKVMPFLEQCLLQQSRQEENQGERRPSNLKVWLLMAFILVAIGLWQFNQYLIQKKWQQVVTHIAEEPGLVVLNQQEKAGVFYLSGLQDPMARRPEAFLPASLLEELDIRLSWSAYFSLEPEIILKRLQSLITVPASVSFELHQQTLFLSGEASEEWFGQFRHVQSQVPGISAIDAAALKRLPASENVFTVEATKLNAKQLYFDSGKVQLSEQEKQKLPGIILVLEKLYSISKENDYPLTILIRGHSDSGGTQGLNQTLSLSRAEAVLQAINNESSLLRKADMFLLKAYGYLLEDESKKNHLMHNRRVDFKIQSKLLERR